MNMLNFKVRPMPMFFSQELCEIIKSMLCIDVSERPSIGDILSRLISIQSTEDSPTPARGPRAATVCLYEPAAVQIDPPANELLRNPLLPPTPARRAVSVPVTPYVLCFHYLIGTCFKCRYICEECVLNCVKSFVNRSVTAATITVK